MAFFKTFRGSWKILNFSIQSNWPSHTFHKTLHWCYRRDWKFTKLNERFRVVNLQVCTQVDKALEMHTCYMQPLMFEKCPLFVAVLVYWSLVELFGWRIISKIFLCGSAIFLHLNRIHRFHLDNLILFYVLKVLSKVLPIYIYRR